MRINKSTQSIHTHEGGVAKHINPEQQLRRTVMSCLLWEKTFYENGQSIADRICELVPKVYPTIVGEIAVQAREDYKLRHVPLLLARELARKPIRTYDLNVASLIERIIQRPDELTEFLAIYWKDGKQPLSGQVKKGLARAFTKFNEYSLAKYNRDGAIKLRDVLFLCHAKPKDKVQASLWKRLIDNTLETPDTWEVGLSAGRDKRQVFEDLMFDKKLGGLAFLRNLRNMEEAGVPENHIRDYFKVANFSRVLPFRFIAASKYAPRYEPELEEAMLKSFQDSLMFQGKTLILMDVSGSMSWSLSGRSEMNRREAGNALAIIARELCSNVEIATFSNKLVAVPPRHGFALRDVINNSQPYGGTDLGGAITLANQKVKYSRIIVITDEQSSTRVPDPLPGSNAYMINVSTNKNGVGYGAWTHIDGFSEATLRYIQEYERSNY